MKRPVAILPALFIGFYVLVDTSDGRIFNYSEGDTIVFEITQVWGRTSGDGKFGDYFINVKVPA